MKKLTKDERTILQEAARIKRRSLNEGPGAGVTFHFEEVECVPVERDPMKHTLRGKLVMRSHGDVSVVVFKSAPLGTLELLESDIIEESLLHEFKHQAKARGEDPEEVLVRWEALEVECISIENRVYGPGFTRLGFDGNLDVTVKVQLGALNQFYDYIVLVEDIPANIQFDPAVEMMYSELDDLDRYSWEDEYGATHNDGAFSESEYTIEI